MATVMYEPRDERYGELGEALGLGIAGVMKRNEEKRVSDYLQRLQSASTPEEFDAIAAEGGASGMFTDMDDLEDLSRIREGKFGSNTVKKRGFDEDGNPVEYNTTLDGAGVDPEGIYPDAPELLFNPKTRQAMMRGRPSDHPELVTADQISSMSSIQSEQSMTVYNKGTGAPSHVNYIEGRPPTVEELAEKGLTTEVPEQRFNQDGTPIPGVMFPSDPKFSGTINKQGADAIHSKKRNDIAAKNAANSAKGSKGLTAKDSAEASALIRGVNDRIAIEGGTAVPVDDKAAIDAAIAYQENESDLERYIAMSFDADVDSEGLISFANVEEKQKRINAWRYATELTETYMIRDKQSYTTARNNAVDTAAKEFNIPVGGGDVLKSDGNNPQTVLGEDNIDSTQPDKKDPEGKPKQNATPDMNSGVFNQGSVNYQIPETYLKKDGKGKLIGIDFKTDDNGNSPLLEELRKQAEKNGTTFDVNAFIEMLKTK